MEKQLYSEIVCSVFLPSSTIQSCFFFPVGRWQCETDVEYQHSIRTVVDCGKYLYLPWSSTHISLTDVSSDGDFREIFVF